MKKMGYVFTFVFLVGLLLTACEPSPSVREQLVDTNIFGEHQLKRIESFGSVTGSVKGNFFLGIGSVDGAIGSEFNLQFYWEPRPDEIIISSLPYSKFKFIVYESKRIPTVEFIFEPQWLSANYYSYGAGDKLNLNDFVMSYRLKIATVRISKETLEKEIYLPKAR